MSGRKKAIKTPVKTKTEREVILEGEVKTQMAYGQRMWEQWNEEKQSGKQKDAKILALEEQVCAQQRKIESQQKVLNAILLLIGLQLALRELVKFIDRFVASLLCQALPENHHIRKRYEQGESITLSEALNVDWSIFSELDFKPWQAKRFQKKLCETKDPLHSLVHGATALFDKDILPLLQALLDDMPPELFALRRVFRRDINDVKVFIIKARDKEREEANTFPTSNPPDAEAQAEMRQEVEQGRDSSEVSLREPAADEEVPRAEMMSIVRNLEPSLATASNSHLDSVAAAEGTNASTVTDPPRDNGQVAPAWSSVALRATRPGPSPGPSPVPPTRTFATVLSSPSPTPPPRVRGASSQVSGRASTPRSASSPFVARGPPTRTPSPAAYTTPTSSSRKKKRSTAGKPPSGRPTKKSPPPSID